MRDLKTLIALILSVLGCSSLSAETLTPYKVNFNIDFPTSAHDFAVGSSWGHKVDYYMYDDGPGYVRYNYHADGGIGNSGCLEIGSQTKVDWDTYQDYELNDMLVTPELSGTVSLYVKMLPLLSSKKGVKFYTMTESDGKWLVGSEIVPTVMDINDTVFTKVELPAQPAGTRIGIRGYYVLIDDFEASSAEVDVKKAFKMVSASWAGGKYTDCDAQGNYKVNFKVKVRNIGDVDLKANDENYGIKLKRQVLNKEIAQTAITQTLVPGEYSDEIEINAVLNKKTYPKAFLYVENEMTGDTIQLATVIPSPYEADFRITGAYGEQPLLTGYRIEYGTSRSEVGVDFFLRNIGSLPQKITEISTSAGFKSSVTGPLEIAGHDSIPLTVSITPDVTGDKHGKLTIKGENGVNIVLNLNGYTVSNSELYYDFETGKVPEGFVTNRGWYPSVMPTYIYSINNSNCLQNGSQDGIMLALPKMKVKEGDKLSFELSKVYSSHTFVDLCYSTDRHNWKVLKTFKAEEMSDSALAESWTGKYYAFTKFVVDDMPTGEWYIGFKSGNVFLDNIVTDYTLVPTEHDGYFDEIYLPAIGKVNNQIRVTSNLHNIINRVEEADDYKVEFYLDDECVGTAAPEELAAMGYRKLSLDVTPHKAGVLNGYWKYVADGVEVISDTTKIDVAAENNAQVNLTGEIAHHNFSTSAPFDVYNWNGESEAIYTADEINLSKGEKITSISWYGCNQVGEIIVTGKVYLQNTGDNEIKVVDGVYSMTAKEQMTKVFEGAVTLAKVGDDYNYECLMTVTFKEPFVYDGGNLRIATHFTSTSAAHVFWASNNAASLQRSVSRNNTDASKLEASEIFREGLPIIGVGYELNTMKVTGKVTNASGKAIAGATVKLVNDNIQYSATTDADGNYSVDVYKSDRDYTMTVSASNYAQTEKVVSFNGQDVTLDVVLDNTTTGVEKVEARENAVVAIFTADGKRVSRLQKGLNIVRMSNGEVKKIIK